jgi:hypothetical protein
VADDPVTCEPVSGRNSRESWEPRGEGIDRNQRNNPMQLPSHRASKCRARPKSAPPAKRMRSAIKNGSVARPRDVVAARKRLVARLRIAKLRHQASIEDVDYRSPAWSRPRAVPKARQFGSRRPDRRGHTGTASASCLTSPSSGSANSSVTSLPQLYRALETATASQRTQGGSVSSPLCSTSCLSRPLVAAHVLEAENNHCRSRRLGA